MKTGLSGIDVLVSRRDVDHGELQLALAAATATSPCRVAVISDLSNYPERSQADVVCVTSSVDGQFPTLLAVDGLNLGPTEGSLLLVDRLSAALRAACLTGTDDNNPFSMWYVEAGQPPRQVYLVVAAADKGQFDIDEK